MPAPLCLIFIGVGARYVPLENFQINFLVGFQMSYMYIVQSLGDFYWLLNVKYFVRACRLNGENRICFTGKTIITAAMVLTLLSGRFSTMIIMMTSSSVS